MKKNHDPEMDKQLHEVLRQWTVDPPLPPRFQEQVWRRIARTEAKPEPTITFWSWLLHLAEVNLPRPKFAYSYVAILLLLGVVGGAWTAQLETSRLDAALGSRYMQAVDPYHNVALNR